MKVQFVAIRIEETFILVDGNLKNAYSKTLVKFGTQPHEVTHGRAFGDVHDSFTNRGSFGVKLLSFWMMIKIVLGDGRKAIALRSTLPILIETCALWTHIIEELQTLVVFLAAALDGLKVY